MSTKRVLLLGATGTAGRAAARALQAAGHDLTCLVRTPPPDLDGARIRIGDVTDPGTLAETCQAGFDAVVSCLASRSGAPRDAWAIDHAAHVAALAAARAAGIGQWVQLSALCVQKPKLAFQHAKLAFEAELMASGPTWSIVRPTAFFKSLAGQIDRVRAGKPFLVFGDGRLTACTPISDGDLGAYLAGCLTDPARQNRILPIGGPGPALTPLDQADLLFAHLGTPPRVRHVPVALLDAIHGVLRAAGTLSARAAEKAELVRIGRYYATESMLVLNPETGRYDAAATPETGSDRLGDFYADVIAGRQSARLGEHAMF